MLFCAFLMLIAAGWRGYRTHIINTRWIETRAQIQKCSLDVYHPFTRDGGAVVYSLFCRLAYEFASHPYEYRLRTTSNRSKAVRSSINDWIAGHGPGTTLNIRVNPSDPKQVAVERELPIPSIQPNQGSARHQDCVWFSWAALDPDRTQADGMEGSAKKQRSSIPAVIRCTNALALADSEVLLRSFKVPPDGIR